MGVGVGGYMREKILHSHPSPFGPPYAVREGESEEYGEDFN